MQVKVLRDFYDTASGMALRHAGDVFECTEDRAETILAVEANNDGPLVEVMPEAVHEKKTVRRAKRTKDADNE